MYIKYKTDNFNFFLIIFIKINKVNTYTYMQLYFTVKQTDRKYIIHL